MPAGMPSSRKRKHGSPEPAPQVRKRLRPLADANTARPAPVGHAILSQYFSAVLTLRDYILRKLPPTSKIRRKKISSLGREHCLHTETADVECAVGALLGSTLVGLPDKPKIVPDKRWDQWDNFAQRADESHVTSSDGLAGAAFSQSEVVDFVIWLLFSRSKTWPNHILCDGFRRDPGSTRFQPTMCKQTSTIPGIFCLFPNPQVDAVKQAPWPQLLKLLGKCGERIMMDLLLDCAVFTSLPGDQGNYYQLSGYPVSRMELLRPDIPRKTDLGMLEKRPSEIIFVRNRMLYARAALNARGLVQFGFRHIHVLNRAPYFQLPDCEEQQLAEKNKINTLRVMMYLFPRQFGLHNAFTSRVDYTETAQRLKDYTLREQEISEKFGPLDARARLPKIPKRLRGEATALVQRLQILHSRCSYAKLLQHYCPVPAALDLKGSSQHNRIKIEKPHYNLPSTKSQPPCKEDPALVTARLSQASSITSLATPPAKVSAFCQAAIVKILPGAFLGTGDVQKHNTYVIRKHIDQFVGLRRFETISLHEVMQGMKVADIEWLASARLLSHKTSHTDIQKRTELFYEFVYYIFDSVLIPLLRSNFYITESNTDKYRLFFFRHDVWRYVAEPAMATLKHKMFEEITLEEANRVLDSRQLGYSQVRLLPKGTSMRPIMNLRKKMVMRGQKKVLGPSINTVLKPVHSILLLEKSLNPDKLGFTLFSVGDIYQRIKRFKTMLSGNTGPLYFAKTDIQSAFDTIPQAALVGLLDSVPQRSEYQIAKHVEIKDNNLNTPQQQMRTNRAKKLLRKWHSTALRNGDMSALVETLKEGQSARANTIVVESVVRKKYDTSAVLQLVASHIQQNLVKVGKKYYRQKRGIPQGSILSATLCNYFYADLETHVLGFLDSENCLLLRLIDDFLLITTDKGKASRFVETMHRGVPEYGVTVNPTKTLVNFNLAVDGLPVRKISSGTCFPYCGMLINSSTLNITKDRKRNSAAAATTSPSDNINSPTFNSLTVEYTRAPGQTFQRKVLNAFRIQSHLMYLDTSLNSAQTMLLNLRSAFVETATKMWAYARCLPRGKKPPPALIIRTIMSLSAVAFHLATSKARRKRYPEYVCDVRQNEVAWLAYCAFVEVLEQKQAGYGEVLRWLRSEIRRLGASDDNRRGRVASLTGPETAKHDS